jgi:aspartyl-tRNA(Asn)/glutamyl-tRNA(Gln) amidotransferase subunit C
MTLTIAQVEHIARLARLELSAEERERFRQQLSAILEYAQSLEELDTSQVPPTFQVLEQPRPLRLDEPAESLTQEQALANTPQQDKRQFRIPPVFE